MIPAMLPVLTPLRPGMALSALVVACLWGLVLRSGWQQVYHQARGRTDVFPWGWIASCTLVAGFGLWGMMLTVVGALQLGVPLVLGGPALLRSLVALLGLHALVFAAAPRLPQQPRARQRAALLLAMVFSGGCALCMLYLFRRLHIAPAPLVPGSALAGLAILVLSAAALSYGQLGRGWRQGAWMGATYWTMSLLSTQTLQWPERTYYVGAPQAVALGELSVPLQAAAVLALGGLLTVLALHRRRRHLQAAPLPSLTPDAAEVEGLAEARAREVLDARRQRDALFDSVLRHSKVRFWAYDATAREYRFTPGALWAASGHDDDALAMALPADDWNNDCLHPQEQADLLQDIAGQLATRGAFDRVHRVRHRRGAGDEWRWVIARGQVVQRSAAGQPLHIVGTHVDITDQQSEQTVLERDGRLFSDGPVVMVRWLFDAEKAKVIELDFVSPNVERLWGYSIEEVYGVRSWRELVEADDLDGVGHKIRAALQGGMAEIAHECRIKLKDGRLLWHSLFARVESQDGRTYLNGFIVDVDAIKRVELRAQEQARRLEELVGELQRAKNETAMLRESSEFLNSAETLDEAFDIISRAAFAIFPGWSGALASAHSHDRLRLAGRWGDAQEFAAEFTSGDCWALRRGRTHHYVDERQSLRCRHVHPGAAGTQPRPYLCIPMSANGETVGSLHLMSPSSLSKEQMVHLTHRANRLGDTLKLALSNLRLRAGLREQATHDGLTGLYNRRFMDDRLPVEIKRCQREGQPLALAMIDVDHFKRINDQFGHEAGDMVLRSLGEVLQRRVRVYDLACRYGGEEIALIMPGCPLTDACDKMEQIRRDVLALRLMFEGTPLPGLSISIGVSDMAGGGTDATSLLKLADERLYEAKRAGRNRVVSELTPAPANAEAGAP